VLMEKTEKSRKLRQIDSILLRSVGERLRECIAASQYTQEQIAHEIGTNRSVLLFYLKGERAIPLDQFLNLSVLLGISPTDLLRVDDESADKLRAEKEACAAELKNVYGELRNVVGTPQHAALKERAEQLESELRALEIRLKFLSVDSK